MRPPAASRRQLRAALPDDCVLYSNEPIRQRASILLENITKWGWEDCTVTNNYPRDYRRSKMTFDVILCDVPCSGEGMFRKDEATIREWSPQNVEKCWQLQRDIVSDAWACLNDGGLLIYSTCTFNTKENEENVRWMLGQFGAQVLPVETQPEWNITGSLLDGFTEPVYRFIPGISRGEGLFMCVLRKKDGGTRGGLCTRGKRLPGQNQTHAATNAPPDHRQPPRRQTSPTPRPWPTFAARPSCCRPTRRAASSTSRSWATSSARQRTSARAPTTSTPRNGKSRQPTYLQRL